MFDKGLQREEKSQGPQGKLFCRGVASKDYQPFKKRNI